MVQGLLLVKYFYLEQSKYVLIDITWLARNLKKIRFGLSDVGDQTPS